MSAGITATQKKHFGESVEGGSLYKVEEELNETVASEVKQYGNMLNIKLEKPGTSPSKHLPEIM